MKNFNLAVDNQIESVARELCSRSGFDPDDIVTTIVDVTYGKEGQIIGFGTRITSKWMHFITDAIDWLAKDRAMSESIDV